MGDADWAAAQLVGIAVAYGLFRRRRAGIQVLKLAAKYAPAWETPHSMLAMEFECQARAETERGATSQAKFSLSQAALHVQRAADLAARARPLGEP